ncbi:MAG TPA: NADP-dependent oxidoreductase [Pseudonocardia sp.]|nr:NADP-dependent oxidoreductase [Pseudonocardia sp.]
MIENEDVPATQTTIAYSRYGAPEVLAPLDRPVPRPGEGELLVRVAAAGVNPADYALRSGRFRLYMRGRLPFVPGSDVAGVVAAVGPGVTAHRPGDAVYAMLPLFTGGGYAPYAVVPQDLAAPAPAGLSLAEAAAMPLAALTALQALRDKAGVSPGASVLVHGASGGVGHFAVQVAKRLGARVTGVTSGRNAGFVTGLGADAVVDYQREDPVAAGPFDVVFDAVAEFGVRRSRRALRPGGVAVTVVPGIDALFPDRLAWMRGGRRLRSVLVQPSGADLRELAAWAGDGGVRPVVEATFPLVEGATAHVTAEKRRVRGKLVLVVDPELAARVPGGIAHT